MKKIREWIIKFRWNVLSPIIAIFITYISIISGRIKIDLNGYMNHFRVRLLGIDLVLSVSTGRIANIVETVGDGENYM